MSSTDRTHPEVAPEAADALRVSDKMVAAPKAMDAGGTVADLRAMFANPRIRTALLVDGAHFAGVVHRDAVTADVADDQPAGELARLDVPTIEPEAPLSDAIRILDAAGDNRLVVLDSDGRTLRGLLCLKSDRVSFCQS
jgi:predicted transcriptional regulator